MRSKFNNLHDLYIVPAVKDLTQVTRGRGSGGLATIWKKSLTKYVSEVSSPNPRLQATMFRRPECPLIIINAYFPCDARSSQYDLEELFNLLSDVDTIIRTND